MESVDTLNKAKKVVDRPIILTQFVFTGLIESLNSLLNSDSALTSLILEGLPLCNKYMHLLTTVGILSKL